MSETTEAAVETHDKAHDDHHPSDWEYIKVAIILAVVTAAEVATYFEAASAVAKDQYQVVRILKYILEGSLN